MGISIHVLDKTSYVMEFTLKVLVWPGGISITVLDRTSYIVEFTLKVLAWS